MPVELSDSLFNSFSEFKRSSSIGYRVDWCVNHLQSNQFGGKPVEEEEGKEKDGENRGLTDFRV